MELLGTFTENTVIGFFLIANGFQNGNITNGITTQYTNAAFNENGGIQSLIFHDPECNSTVVCFEDITIPAGDNDYNDAIFEISTNPANAIDVEQYLQL